MQDPTRPEGGTGRVLASGVKPMGILKQGMCLEVPPDVYEERSVWNHGVGSAFE